jgi:tetratricopeptide (TPR) repeat protein
MEQKDRNDMGGKKGHKAEMKVIGLMLAVIVVAVGGSAQQPSPAPAVPEEARHFFVQANAVFKQAQNKDDYERAAGLYQQALKVAPQWGNAWYNLSKAQEKLEKYDEAISSLKTFLRCSPQDPEARAAQDHVYELELSRTNQAKAAELRRAAQRKAAYLTNLFAGAYSQTWVICDAHPGVSMSCTDEEAKGKYWHTTNYSDFPGQRGYKESFNISLTGPNQDTLRLNVANICILVDDYSEVQSVYANKWKDCGAEEPGNLVYTVNLDARWGRDRAVYVEKCLGKRAEDCSSRWREYYIVEK